MGVFGLQSFMEDYSLLSKENIGTLAEEFMKSQNKAPILLIDFSSCFNNIYNNANLDKICGGQNKEFVNVFKRLIENFEKFGIKCVFFCNGYPAEQRQDVWIKRRDIKIKSKNAIMSAIDATNDELQKVQDEFNQSEYAATGAWFSAMNYLRSINAKLIQTSTPEATNEIISYFKQENCFGVLAQNSTFVIAEEVVHYFSSLHLDVLTLDTMEYRRDKLTEEISLRPDFLPLFGTMCGNDRVNVRHGLCFQPLYNLFKVHKLRNFHCKLLQIPYTPRIAPVTLFPKIAEWINEQSKQVDLKNSPEQVAVMIGLPELSRKFIAGVKCYLPGGDTLPPQVLSGNSTWDAIVAETNDKMRNLHQYSKIHGVLVSQVIFSSLYLQYFSNDLYPCDEKVGAKLRQKFYGILLKEHPKSKSIKVKEFVSSGKKGSQSVAPIFPGNHPGLLSMWSAQGTLLDEKWQLLGWAVGNGVPLNLVRPLPEPLQIPTLALFYIKHESKILELWQASALALQAVILLRATPVELQKIDCICQDGVAVHLATVYQSLCMWVSYVSEACGNPTCLFKFKDYAMFDGKLFHSIYLSFKRQGNFGSYLDKLNEEEAGFFKQMNAVIRR